MRSIAFLGVGIMGSRMAVRLLAAEFDVTVWNRTPGPAEALRAQGAAVARSPADAARAADVVITMLGDPASVKDVALGPGGLVAALHPGQVYVDMTTVDPDTAKGVACVGCKPATWSTKKAVISQYAMLSYLSLVKQMQIRTGIIMRQDLLIFVAPFRHQRRTNLAKPNAVPPPCAV